MSHLRILPRFPTCTSPLPSEMSGSGMIYDNSQEKSAGDEGAARETNLPFTCFRRQ